VAAGRAEAACYFRDGGGLSGVNVKRPTKPGMASWQREPSNEKR
jgi:hypothetical protein